LIVSWWQQNARKTKQTVFRFKADITVCGNPLSRSLLEVKRTWPAAVQMSAYDPKRTSASLTTSSSG
jgi:hypothetical protein